MKRLYAIILCLCLLLSGCGQGAPQQQPQPQTPQSTVEAAESPPANINPASAPPEISEPALCFSVEAADPMNMEPTYQKGHLTFRGTLIPGKDGGYESDLHMTRYFPQGISPMTGAEMPDGYINFSYDSCGAFEPAALAEETESALDEASSGDTGARFYGFLPMQIRNTQHFFNVTGSLLLPYDFVRAFSTVTNLPCLLTRSADTATLYLYMNPFSILKLEGALAVASAGPEAEQPEYLTQLYINDELRTPEVDKQKDVWNLLFLGSGDQKGYSGTLRLWRYGEKSGSYGTICTYIPNDADAYEQQITLEFAPFDEAAYLAVGGTLNPQRRAQLSAMAQAQCGGQTLLFTVSADEVYAELTEVPSGVMQGKFTEDAAIPEIHDEALTLYRGLDAMHRSKPGASPESGGLGSIPGGEEAKAAYWSDANGLPIWMPKNFLILTRPIFELGKRPSTASATLNFQYTEDGLWLDTIGPIYRAHFADVRDVRIEEEEEMEILFPYGNRVVEINLHNSPIGTAVSTTIY